MSEPAARAAGLLRSAMRRAAYDYPLHARFLAKVTLLPSAETGSVALTVDAFRFVLLFSPEYVCRSSVDQCAGILLHVVNHVLFGHLTMDPSEYDDEDALVVAQEVTANEWVREPLPDDAITLKQYPSLPALEDTDRRYNRLRKRSPKKQPSSGGSLPKPGTGGGVAASKTLDDHSRWLQMSQGSGIVARGVVAEAVNELTPEETCRLDPQIAAAARGLAAGQAHEGIGPAQAVTLPWPVLLRRFLTRGGEPTHSLTRPARRLPDLVGIVPGKRRMPSRARVMAVVDTSGSMSQDDLSVIAAELRKLAEHADMTIVQCDALVHTVEPFTGSITKVVGRGGTDFRPPFEVALLRKVRPSVLIYFTDGFGPAPTKRPGVPVIWGVTEHGVKPAPWGAFARLTRKQS